MPNTSDASNLLGENSSKKKPSARSVIRRAIRLYRLGMSVRKVAQAVGVHYQWLMRELRTRGITRDREEGLVLALKQRWAKYRLGEGKRVGRKWKGPRTCETD